jgi:23S rRNA (uracil1939-C5)-methyltransferase
MTDTPLTSTTQERLDLRLEGMAYGGEAFGRDTTGRMVFVPFALPGERISAQVIEAHAHWCRARLIEVLEPSADRVAPRCRHFGACGGCHYQHLQSLAQPAVKQAILRAQLERLGGFRDPSVSPTVSSPPVWNYRNHVQFSQASDGRLGFQAAHSHQVLPIEECHLPEPAIGAVWPALQIDPIPGLGRVALRCAGDETQIIFHAEDDPGVELELDLRASAVWLCPGGAHNLAGDPSLIFSVRGRPFRVHAGSFFQVNTALTSSLVDLVLDGLQISPGQTVFDLYAGVGLFSAFVAEQGAQVLSVEQSSSACDDLAFNLDDFDAVSLYQAGVEQALPALPANPDAAIVDPPRAGLGPEVAASLIAHAPARLVYVSCDPSTLARDGRMLADAGYQLERVTPVDLFPQTFHIESVSVWTR